MPEKLYPKPRRKRDVTQYPWRIEYKLNYDGGSSEWSGYYRYKFQARVMAWWNVYISSWGGTAVLFNQSKGE